MDGIKLNPEKTEFIIIGDRQAREFRIQKFPTQLLENSISPTDTVKNLCVGLPLSCNTAGRQGGTLLSPTW